MAYGLGIYKYNLDCFAQGYEDEDRLFDFKARQYVESEKNASFVNGGIASFGQMTVIATTDKRIETLEPYKNQVNVEGIMHMLTSIKVFKREPIGGYKSFQGHKEYILTLE